MTISDDTCIIELDGLLLVVKDVEKFLEEGQYCFNYILLLYYLNRSKPIKLFYETSASRKKMFDKILEKKSKSVIKKHYCNICNSELALGRSRKGKSTGNCSNCGNWVIFK